MTNHFHLLIETPDGNLSLGMRQLNAVYTQLFNKWYGRVGHLFQGRYKAILIQKDSHLLEIPVCRPESRAGKDGREADEWKWSSYLATAGKIMLGARPFQQAARPYEVARIMHCRVKTADRNLRAFDKRQKAAILYII
jgi:hypothetical protein